jgi:hypothetical protein
MKPSDIEIGATYAHSEYPGTVYLGCGDYGYRGHGHRKFLIILKESCNLRRFCGAKVKHGKLPADRAWWNQFRKLSSRHA